MIFLITKNMNLAYRYFLFVIVVTVVGSCKKKDYPNEPAVPTPVFTFNGNIDGSPVSISAGMNNYYMSTSYSMGTNGVYGFGGQLKDASCTSGCTNSLKISINDYRKYATLPTTADSSLAPGYYAYGIPLYDSTIMDAGFYAVLNNGTASGWAWDFGDGGSANIINPVHRYLHPGVYHTMLSIYTTSACTTSISRNVQIGQIGNAFEAIFNHVVSGNSVTFTPGTNGKPPYTYSWNFGDGAMSASALPVHVYTAPGVYQASLTKTDGTGYTDTYPENIAIQTTTDCLSKLYVTGVTKVPNPTNLANVFVEWADANGTWWTSNNLAGQANTSMFRILSVENYENNSSGQKTKKIHAKMTCRLYHSTQSVLLDNADVVFSVAYP